MYLYETHLHTSPVSRCARADVRESLAFYKALGSAGVFITNHFIDGNINIDKALPYAEKIAFYCSDYENGLEIARELGISLFFGVEMSYSGTDFLIYGLPPTWYAAHPEIEGMKKSALLEFLAEEGALIIQAHPFRDAEYIDHIRLYPRNVHGVEVYNASRPDAENKMAELYAEHYGLLRFAGSDNHTAKSKKTLGGMRSQTPIKDELDFVARVKANELEPFSLENPLTEEN